MKLSSPMSATVDTENETLIIQGTDHAGEPAVVEIAYGDSHEFMAWLLSVFQQHSLEMGEQRAILAEDVNVGMHKGDESGAHMLSFNFVAGDLNLTFITPLRTKSPARIAAIQRHLEQLFAEMVDPDDVKTQ